MNRRKSDGNLLNDRLPLAFEVNLAAGLFKIPLARWEALCVAADTILGFTGKRVQARKLASLIGTGICMKLAWDPVTKLYRRQFYHIISDVMSLDCWVYISDEAHNELFYWNDILPPRFESDIRPCTTRLSIKVATDARDFRWVDEGSGICCPCIFFVMKCSRILH